MDITQYACPRCRTNDLWHGFEQLLIDTEDDRIAFTIPVHKYQCAFCGQLIQADNGVITEIDGPLARKFPSGWFTTNIGGR